MTTIRLTLLPTKGIYCQDDAGNRWTTWTGTEQRCSECGTPIRGGYVRFTNRAADRYLCPEHVTLVAVKAVAS